MGEVYLANDTQLRRQVAIKLLPVEFTDNKTRLSRFEHEAYAASSLNHPNILTIHEIGQQDGQHYIATEYVEGESLRQRLTRGHLDVRELLGIAAQVADALSAAHEAGIVHRDIKPENVMVRHRDGYVKVLDFGLAKAAKDSVAKQPAIDQEAPTRTRIFKTEPGMVVGTASYMSPEQARGLALDARSDIWSLGVMLYEMASGRLPFQGPTTTDVLSVILHKEPPSLLLHSEDMPAELERIVEKALAKDREERYQVIKDMALDLRRLKQRLEMDVELERSISPDEGARHIADRLSLAGGPVSATPQTSAASTSSIRATQTAATADHLLGRIQSHKRAALLVLTILVLATVVAAFSYLYYHKSSSQAISSIAVLPFANGIGDPNMDYLSDGISESLINALAQLPGLKVIARGSVFKYKGREIDPEEVARALGVQAVVIGRVAQRSDQLQISAEMVDARDNTHMWGEQYSRKATDLQAVQEEMAHTIAGKLRLRLTAAEEQQLYKRATQNSEAYQLYLNGLFFRRKGGIENSKSALDYYTEAVKLDPNFSQAYAGVADAYRYLGAFGVLDPKDALARAKTAVAKALETDETLAEAHVALAIINGDSWDWAGAEREFRRAIELNPNLADAHHRFAAYLSNTERHTEAFAENARAQELDPLRVTIKADGGARLYWARRYDEAIEKLQEAIRLEPDNGYAHVYLGYTYATKGMYAQAVEEYRKQISIDGETASTQIFLGYALAKSGRTDEAKTILNKLKNTKEYVSPAELSILYAGLGDKEAALASLERAYQTQDPQMQYLKIDPHRDSLRSDARFQDLLRRVGLAR